MFGPFTVWINCSRYLKSFSRSLEQFFLTVGQNNFGNKIPFLTNLFMLFKSCYYYSRATIIADNCFAVYQSPRRKLYQSPRRKYRAVIYIFGLASTFKVHTYCFIFCIFCKYLYNKLNLIWYWHEPWIRKVLIFFVEMNK